MGRYQRYHLQRFDKIYFAALAGQLTFTPSGLRAALPGDSPDLLGLSGPRGKNGHKCFDRSPYPRRAEETDLPWQLWCWLVCHGGPIFHCVVPIYSYGFFHQPSFPVKRRPQTRTGVFLTGLSRKTFSERITNSSDWGNCPGLLSK